MSSLSHISPLTIRASDFFSAEYYQAYAEATLYTAHLMTEVFERLGADALLREGATLSNVAEAVGCLPSQQAVLSWGLRFLAEQGWLESTTENKEQRFRWAHPDFTRPETHAHMAAGMPLLEHAAQVWPAVITGEVDGVVALLRGEAHMLWEQYFHAGHTLYHVHNLWGAAAVSELLPRRGRILELGVGFGSAALAVIAELAELPGEYLVSDINLLMARRASTRLMRQSPGLPTNALKIDFNRDLVLQGLVSQSLDMIYACNALHCATDLVGALRQIRGVLRPGGHLVLSECARPFPLSTLHQEFIFTLLGSYRDVKLVHNRTCSGFLPPHQWQSVLEEAGFADAFVVTNQANPAEPVLGILGVGVAP